MCSLKTEEGGLAASSLFSLPYLNQRDKTGISYTSFYCFVWLVCFLQLAGTEGEEGKELEPTPSQEASNNLNSS